MALALYRRYRPRTFAEMIGQEHVTEPLMQALRTGRLHHAYLFSGPRGCGKTTSARILARSLNCAQGPTPEPCGVCESCQALASDGPGSIDVIEIDAASHGGVDDARDLRERAFFAPVASRYKVYVIDEAHMVSTQGFNALLKLVEEPPEYVTFVFATTEPEKVLGTIRSRTHHYPFRLIPPGVLRPYLERLCAKEGVAVEPAVFPLVVRAGGGSVRDALSVLDQLIAGATDTGVAYARAVALLGVTDVALIDEICDALAAADGAAAFGTIDRVTEAGHDPRRFAADLLERLRDLIVLQQVPDAVRKGLIDAPEDELDRMAAQAARIGPGTLSRMADIVHNGLTEMRGTTAPRLLLELIVARMLLPGADESAGAVLQRLERMERRLGATAGDEATPVSGPPGPGRPTMAGTGRDARPAPAARAAPASARPAETAAPPSTPDPAGIAAAPDTGADPTSTVESVGPAAERPEEPALGQLDAAAVRRVWDEILGMIRRRSPRSWAIAREATVRDVHGDTLVLLFQHAVHADLFSAAPELLVEAVGEVIGGTWRVRCEVAGQAQAPLPDLEPAAGGPSSGRPGRPAPVPRSGEEPPPSSAEPPEDDGWPTPARLGGAGNQAADAGSSVERDQATARPAGATRGGRATAGASRSSTGQSGRAPARRGEARARVPVEASARGPGELDGFDPGGFDPGDGPADDDQANPTRGNSEQQALQLLADQLGAEKIGEVDHRRRG